MLRRKPLSRKPFKRRIVKADGPDVAREPRPLAKQDRPSSYSGGVSGVAVGKAERAPNGKAEHEHKDALAQLGCMVCRRLYGAHAPGPVELHHLRAGGWGKGDWTTLIPLCREHHQGASGVHGLGTKGFVEVYGFTQADLLLDAMTLLKGGKE